MDKDLRFGSRFFSLSLYLLHPRSYISIYISRSLSLSLSLSLFHVSLTFFQYLVLPTAVRPSSLRLRSCALLFRHKNVSPRIYSYTHKEYNERRMEMAREIGAHSCGGSRAALGKRDRQRERGGANFLSLIPFLFPPPAPFCPRPRTNVCTYVRPRGFARLYKYAGPAHSNALVVHV